MLFISSELNSHLLVKREIKDEVCHEMINRLRCCNVLVHRWERLKDGAEYL